jgi:hypothetical protein
MAGKLIIDTIQTESSFLQMNVSNTLVATINSGGIYSATGTKIIGSDGSISTANTLYLGANATSPLGGTTNPILGMILAANNYVQGYIYNPSNTALSSADIACYPSNGSDANGWIDMGITSNTYSYSGYPITGRNEGYILMSAPGNSGTSGNLVFATDSTGLYNSIQFYTGNFTQAKTNAKMTVSTSGVGIGVTNATQAQLEIAGTTGISIKSAAGDSNGLKLSMDANGLANVNAGYASSNLAFQIGGTEKVRIYNDGTVKIGMQNFAAAVSSSNFGMSLNNTNAGSYSYAYSTTTNTHWGFGNGNGGTGSIQTNGTSTSFNTTSDYRLKKDVIPMSGALAKVAQLKPCTYKWKVDNSNGQGFIAHELKSVVPECVSGEKDAVDENNQPIYQQVDTSFLVATLTAAIQEQQAIIADLKTRIEVLEAK